MFIYLLSILNNLSIFFISMSTITWLLFFILIVVYFDHETTEKTKNTVKKYITPTINAAIMFSILSLLTPNRKALIESYIAIKGKQIVENPTKTIATVDSIIDYINKRLK